LAEEVEEKGEEESRYSRLKGMWGQGETDCSKTPSQQFLHQYQSTRYGSFHIKQTLYTSIYFMMTSD
jgi:hypothetical protein